MDSTLDLEGWFWFFCFVLFYFFKTCVPVFYYFRSAEITTRHKLFQCLALGEQTGKGILWQEYGEAAFHKLILRRLSYLKVKSCIICEKDLI